MTVSRPSFCNGRALRLAVIKSRRRCAMIVAALAGTVMPGSETHIGVGTLDGTLIVGATLVGYDPRGKHTAKLSSK
jgi:hypothetical protein